MSTWQKTITREHDAPCLGNCGYLLPLFTMAVLRPEQRNHYARGRCRPCYDRDKHELLREETT
jgi:hypothetical protein